MSVGHSGRCVTHNELGGDYPVHDGTEKRCDHSDADEDDRRQELRDRV